MKLLFIEKVLFILLVMIKLLSLLHMTKNGLNNFGLAKRFGFIRFGTKLHRQIAGIPMGTNSAPLKADFFLLLFAMKEIS